MAEPAPNQPNQPPTTATNPNLTAANDGRVENTSSSASSPTTTPWKYQTKKEVWDAHPREDSYGCLLIADIEGKQLDCKSLGFTPVERLRFLLVQRRSTGSWSNLINDLQESPSMPGAKEHWWVAREASRCTDRELDALNGPFEEMWNDDTRVNLSWRVHFKDCNESFAREKYPILQRIADEIRATRYFNGTTDPDDEHNLQKLAFVIPKGQLQTKSSVQRLPHLTNQIIDADVFAGAIREVVEETNIPASDFTIAPPEEPPITFTNFPPRKVDIFLAFLHPDSSVHPTRKTSWYLPPQAETRACRWMSLTEVLDYFTQAKIFPKSYTSNVIHQAMQRFGWNPSPQRPLMDHPTLSRQGSSQSSTSSQQSQEQWQTRTITPIQAQPTPYQQQPYQSQPYPQSYSPQPYYHPTVAQSTASPSASVSAPNPYGWTTPTPWTSIYPSYPLPIGPPGSAVNATTYAQLPLPPLPPHLANSISQSTPVPTP